MIPAIPLPFVVALMLAILLARLVAQRDRQLMPVIVFVAACACLAVLTGIYWTFAIAGMGLWRLAAASLVPPLAWFCFARLTEFWTPQRLWLAGLLPLVVAALLGVMAPQWLDLMLAALFLGYGAALVRLALRGPDGLSAVRLGEVKGIQKAALAVGAAMIGSGLIDLLIGLDFRFQGGAHVRTLVAIANAIALPVAAYAAIVVGSGVAAPQGVPDEGDKPTASSADDARILDVVAALMRERSLFRDPDLTLNRLARQAGIPARQISEAVNRAQGRSVSQMVNEYRLAEAMRLLRETGLAVTQVMLESGFQTKSHFNREFLRATGKTPSDWRRCAQDLS